MSEEERIVIEVYPNGLRHVYGLGEEVCGLTTIELLETLCRFIGQIEDYHRKEEEI